MAGALTADTGAAPPWAELGLLARSLIPAGRGAGDAGFASALSRMADLDEYVRGRIAETVNELNARETAKAAARGAAPSPRTARPALPARPASLAPGRVNPAAQLRGTGAGPTRAASEPAPQVTARSEYRDALLENPSLAGALASLGAKLTGRAQPPRAPQPSQTPVPEAAAAPPARPEPVTEAFVPAQPPPIEAGFKPSSRFRKTFEGVHPIFSDRPTAGR
jgi:hypothetical protein